MEEMALWAEGTASAKALWLDQLTFWQSRKMLGYSRVSEERWTGREQGSQRGWTYGDLEAEGTNVGLFLGFLE